MQLIVSLIVVWLSFGTPALASTLTGPKQLKAAGAKFGWSEIKSKSLKIFVEHKDRDGNWKRANLGSGFLISADGLFVTAYHVMKYCLHTQTQTSRFSNSVDCSLTDPPVRYKALNGDREYEIQIVSHLNEEDSTSGREMHTPDEIIKNRDFVIGKLKAPAGKRFAFWELKEYEQGTISLHNPRADFELKPLFPPRQVFIAGYPQNRDFQIVHGFLNLKDERHRGYFAANYKVYSAGYLLSEGISPNTKWGMRVENHMSGGPVADIEGNLVGVIVNGSRDAAGILSIENILETFFSRKAKPGTAPALFLGAKKTPLFLREHPTE